MFPPKVPLSIAAAVRGWCGCRPPASAVDKKRVWRRGPEGRGEVRERPSEAERIFAFKTWGNFSYATPKSISPFLNEDFAGQSRGGKYDGCFCLEAQKSLGIPHCACLPCAPAPPSCHSCSTCGDLWGVGFVLFEFKAAAPVEPSGSSLPCAPLLLQPPSTQEMTRPSLVVEHAPHA
jgi:hypothetical protein